MACPDLKPAVLLGEAVANADYVILVADEAMRYLAASDAACGWLGYSREELLDMSVPDLVVESNAPDLYDEFLRDQAQQGTITLRRKDGRLLIANYDARKTVVQGSPCYVSVLSPLGGDSRHRSELEPGLRELHDVGFVTETELDGELGAHENG